ncbi:MAG: hypothetical protein IPH06_09465 [Alphaproteobacteria bacterium]|nr:hypothetical protein [Alphaproteobacteria bacterium]QQS58223.1 MAG: hypothetical protein IPN28_05225 [Alphaproteobacteria bacterium]
MAGPRIYNGFAGTVGYTVTAITGRVLHMDAQTSLNVSTTTSTGGGTGYVSPLSGHISLPSVSTTTSANSVTTRTVFLMRDDGQEDSLSLRSVHFEARPDNIVTFFTIQKQGDKYVYYFRIVNHSTGKVFDREQDLMTEVFDAIGWAIIGALVYLVVGIIYLMNEYAWPFLGALCLNGFLSFFVFFILGIPCDSVMKERMRIFKSSPAWRDAENAAGQRA